MDSTLSSSEESTPPYSDLQCPYARDGLESSAEHRQVACPFAHHNQGSFIIPKFVCTKYLFGRECNEPVMKLLVGDSQHQVKNCADGIHPPLDSDFMHHLKEITAWMAQTFWSIFSDCATQDRDELPSQCHICLEDLGFSNPDRFGLLLDCPHVFCAHCLNQWTNAQPEGGARCPVCRRDYTKVMHSSRLDMSYAEKAELYLEQTQEQEKNFFSDMDELFPTAQSISRSSSSIVSTRTRRSLTSNYFYSLSLSSRDSSLSPSTSPIG